MRNVCSQPECDRPAYGRGLCSRHYQFVRRHGELPAERPPRICEQCGQEFTGRKWNARFCSKTCVMRSNYERKRPPRRAATCEQCGTSLADRPANTRFCSPKCADTWRNAQTSAALRAAKAAAVRPCRGCGSPLPAERPMHAHYCSDACKSTSRRHQSYGLTKQELDVLLAQHDRCAICGGGWSRKGPQVDHCHKSGQIRGVLCANCNQGLGRFADDPGRLRAAADYLERGTA